MAPLTMKSRTVNRVSSRSPCARGMGVACASRRKSAGCRYQCNGSSSQKMFEGSTARANAMQVSTSYGAFMSSMSATSFPIASRTLWMRRASSATLHPPVFSLTAL